MLTLLTATGARPKAWAICELWMARQTYRGDVRWIIVDDGEQAQPINFDKKNWTLEVVRPNPFWQEGMNTQARNLRAGMDLINPNEKVVFIEDDDWYAADWLETVDELLEKAELVGESHARYYNLPQKSYRQMQNATHSSLCSTAIRGQALDTFRSVCRASVKFIDVLLWQAHSNNHLFSGEGVLGIKGMEGRGGIGVGHAKEFRGSKDVGGKILRSWIGDDALVYKPVEQTNDSSITQD